MTRTSFQSLDADAARQFGTGWDGARPRHAIIVVNADRFFLTHRASWAIALQASGTKVTVIAADTGLGESVRAIGVEFVPMDMGRESISPAKSLGVMLKLFIALTRRRPDVVLLVGTAPYTLGWPAALFLRKSKFVLALTGAGRVLSGDHEQSMASRVVEWQLKLAARLNNVSTLFQLESDRDRFISRELARSERAHVVRGTGLDVGRWAPDLTARSDRPVVLFAARLFREKGIYEFVRVAEALQHAGARFVVVGAPDAGVSTSVEQTELTAWQESGTIEYWGLRNDMAVVYQSADIFVFPSVHPEGTPRVLIEAAACELALVASDQDGCRSVVVDGVSGILVDPTDHDALRDCVAKLIADQGLRSALASRARDHVVEVFSIDAVLRQIFELLTLPKSGSVANESASDRE